MNCTFFVLKESDATAKKKGGAEVVREGSLDVRPAARETFSRQFLERLGRLPGVEQVVCDFIVNFHVAHTHDVLHLRIRFHFREDP